ncbi:MAG TPA: SRPBCC domain-containing protein [Steroidobacteraceae bacterium]|nr:SRPBCC domain-containing protein [Steroidobacteraceae bacterium]
MSGDGARVSVSVATPPARAFQVFTADIDQWWRRGLKFRHSASRGGLLCIEPRVGGRLFESFDAQGTQHIIEVGRVRVWEPPHRLAFSWRSANFAPHEHTDVDIQFEPSASGTLVTVTHSGFSALRADHPVRHGLQDAEFCRMIGLWWGEQMSSLRLVCAAQSS